MMSAALPRGPLVNLILPGAAQRGEAPVWRSPSGAGLLAGGAAFAAMGIWLATTAYAGGTPAVAGIGFGPRTIGCDALMAVAIVYLLALANRLVAGRLARDAALVASGVLLLALCAQVILRLPFTPVPITGQTFAVLVVGASLGWKRGISSVLAYIGLGAAGIPVFADVTTAAADGYLIGFALAALVVGWLAERGWDRRPGSSIVAMLAGEVAIYLVGLPWLAHFVGWSNVLAFGLIPFIPGDALKLAAAALALPAAWHITGRARSGRHQESKHL